MIDSEVDWRTLRPDVSDDDRYYYEHCLQLTGEIFKFHSPCMLLSFLVLDIHGSYAHGYVEEVAQKLNEVMIGPVTFVPVHLNRDHTAVLQVFWSDEAIWQSQLEDAIKLANQKLVGSVYHIPPLPTKPTINLTY